MVPQCAGSDSLKSIMPEQVKTSVTTPCTAQHLCEGKFVERKSNELGPTIDDTDEDHHPTHATHPSEEGLDDCSELWQGFGEPEHPDHSDEAQDDEARATVRRHVLKDLS